LMIWDEGCLRGSPSRVARLTFGKDEGTKGLKKRVKGRRCRWVGNSSPEQNLLCVLNPESESKIISGRGDLGN